MKLKERVVMVVVLALVLCMVLMLMVCLPSTDEGATPTSKTIHSQSLVAGDCFM